MSLTDLSNEEQKFFDTGGAQAPPETPATATPTPTPAPAPADTAKQDDKTVPLAALHEARQIQKELREELRRRDESIQAAQSKAEKMEQTFQAFLQKQNEVPAPKYEEDPLGALKWQNEQLEKRLTQVNTDFTKTAQTFQQQQAMQSFSQHIIAQEDVFRQTQPDYDAAVEHMKKVRLSDFQDMGFDDVAARQMLDQEIVNFAQAAMRQGKNPAQAAYSIAKRYGYTPAAQTSEKQLEVMQKGQEAAKALPGGNSEAPITLEALAQLDDDQIDQLVKDEKAWKKMLGGR